MVINVLFKDVEVELANKEFDVLIYFIENKCVI